MDGGRERERERERERLPRNETLTCLNFNFNARSSWNQHLHPDVACLRVFFLRRSEAGCRGSGFAKWICEPSCSATFV